MYKGQSLLAIIPARSGSKALPGKNIKPFQGKPLIAWTILSAVKSRYIDKVIISTDDINIARIGRRYGAKVPFLRPVELARDKSGTVDVVLHALSFLENKEESKWDYLLLLQPTSPLRSHADIDGAIKAFFSQKKADALVSVAESSENPYWAYSISRQGFLRPVIRQKKEKPYRQGLPKCYRLNGAIYICSTKVFKRKLTFLPGKTVCYLMPKERSVDIDDSYDFEVAEMFLEKRSALRR